MNIKETIGERINCEIVRSGCKAKDIADMLGCTVQAVNQFRSGKAIPKLENLITLSCYFDCSLDYLIGDSDVRSSDMDMQAVCKRTGLSEDTVKALESYNGDKRIVDKVILALVGD